MTYQLDPGFTREYIKPADEPPYDYYDVLQAYDEGYEDYEFEPPEIEQPEARRP